MKTIHLLPVLCLALLFGCASPKPYSNLRGDENVQVITTDRKDRFEYASQVLETSPQYRIIFTLTSLNKERRALQVRTLFYDGSGMLVETTEPETRFFFPERPVAFEVAALADPSRIARHQVEILEPVRLPKPQKPKHYPQ